MVVARLRRDLANAQWLAAQVALPPSLTTLNASDDSATDRDLVTSLILFRDGFE